MTQFLDVPKGKAVLSGSFKNADRSNVYKKGIDTEFMNHSCFSFVKKFSDLLAVTGSGPALAQKFYVDL